LGVDTKRCFVQREILDFILPHGAWEDKVWQTLLSEVKVAQGCGSRTIKWWTILWMSLVLLE